MKTWWLAAAVFLMAAPVSAQTEYTTGIQLTPFVGYTIGGKVDADFGQDDERNFSVADAANFGFAVNWRAKPPTEWEVYFNRQDTNFKQDGPDITFDTLQIGGTYLWPQARSAPYFVATLGATRAKVSGFDSDYFVGFTAGVGYKYFPTRHFGLRAEARALGTVVSSNNSWFCGIDGGANCVIRTSGNILLQAQANIGVIFRF